MSDEKPPRPIPGGDRAAEATEMYAARIPLADIQKHFGLSRQGLWDLLMSLPPGKFPVPPAAPPPSDLDTFRAMMERAGIVVNEYGKDISHVPGTVSLCVDGTAFFEPDGRMLTREEVARRILPEDQRHYEE